MGRFLRQTGLLLQKNWLIARRNWRSTTLQLLAPVLFMFILWVCQQVPLQPDVLSPVARPVGASVPRCTPFATPSCTTLAYAYDKGGNSSSSRAFSEDDVDEIVARFAAAAGLSGADDVRKFNGSAALDAFIEGTPNATQSAVVFYPLAVLGANETWGDRELGLLPYSLYYNLTSWSDMPMNAIVDALTYHLDRAIAGFALGAANESSADSDGGSDNFAEPFVALGRSFPIYATARFDAVAFIGPTAFFCSVMASQIVFIQMIVSEKEAGLRGALRQLGVSDLAYWISFVVHNLVFAVLLALITIAAGAAFCFRFFLYASFPAILITFVIFGVSMMPLSTLLSIVAPNTRSALNAGLGMFLLGVLFQMMFSTSFVLRALYSPSVRWLASLLQVLWAPFNFARVLAEISGATPQNDLGTGDAFKWEDLFKVTDAGDYTVPQTADAWGWSALNFVIYLILSVLFYLILQNEGGQITRAILRRRKTRAVADSGEEDGAAAAAKQDEDVAEEEYTANDPTCAATVRVKHVFKNYGSIFSRKTVRAVRGVSLTVREGEIFALLGHNSAGKTTLLSVMSGNLEPSAGDVIVRGKSVKYDADAVRKIISVCAQHDNLLSELTAREHLRLWARLKGFKAGPELEAEIDQRLHDVLLSSAANKRAGTYSGGMKRRLSVALATIGSPKVVLLDEPTTGLDPSSRRQIWASIQRLKQTCAVILTSHSMEEADALGDRVAIMAAGTLRCLGSSLHLKGKFGLGFQLSLNAPEGMGDRARDCVTRMIPGSSLLAQTNEFLKFGVPPTALEALAAFLRRVEAHHGTAAEDEEDVCPVANWGISQTSLEEVFIRMGIVHEEGASSSSSK